MNADTEYERARRYLLGAVNEEESAVIEQEYFESGDALDRVAAAEDDLIEDYLADQLSTSERNRFEVTYLSVPQHRVRVETIRRLQADAKSRGSIQPRAPKPSAPKRVVRFSPWLALAASLLVVVSAALWMLSPFGRPQTTTAGNRTVPSAPNPAPSPAAPAPRAFALTISPVAVRSATEAPTVLIPPGTDVVAMRLERDADARALAARRVSIRTVAGVEVWQGAVAGESGAQAIAARVDVPAAQLPADDYLVTLFGADPAGVEQEWTQYFLRVRDR